MRERDEQAFQRKKAEIMEACFNCYAENGLTGTGIQALADACGLSKASLYTYFDTLDDLIVQSTAYCMSKVEDDFMRLAPTSPQDIQRFIDEVPYWTAKRHGKKYRLMYQVYTHPKYIEHGKRFFAGVTERYSAYARQMEPHLGIPCELFLGRTDPPLSEDDQETGNILLCRILGAQVHLVPPGADRGAAMRRRAEKLRAEGRHPYIIPRGSSTAEGALGSLRCFFELLDQAQASGFTPNAIAVTVGSSGTTAGRTSPSTPSTPSARTTRCRPVNASWNTPRSAGLRFPCPEDAGKGCCASPAISWGRAIPGPTPA